MYSHAIIAAAAGITGPVPGADGGDSAAIITASSWLCE
jgi:hypothetical protein